MRVAGDVGASLGALVAGVGVYYLVTGPHEVCDLLDGGVQSQEPALLIGVADRVLNARLRLDFPDDESMRISHEAIYQSLYIEGRGALKRELVWFSGVHYGPHGNGHGERRGRMSHLKR